MDELSELILDRMLTVYTAALEKIPGAVPPQAARDSAAFTAIAEQFSVLWEHLLATSIATTLAPTPPGALSEAMGAMAIQLRQSWGIPARDLDS